LLEQLKPKVVLMENVPGIGEVRFPDGSTFQDVTMQAMVERGYLPTIWTLNAAHYGVPQLRFRRVIVGIRKGYETLNPPVALYSASSNQFRHSHQPALFETLEPAITLMEAIGDLQHLEADDGTWVAKHQRPHTPSRYLQAFGITHPQGLVFSHITRFHNEEDLKRFDGLEPGETYMDLIRKHPNLKNYRTDVFDDKYYRLRSNAPSRTIVAHLRKDGNSFIHPEQRRSLSVREAARLQSFNDEYIFTGSRGDQFEQIGNAVPPLMARAMAQVIHTYLKKYQRQFRR
jgi:DNA (cytosine-5)-methyltransferase 1